MEETKAVPDSTERNHQLVPTRQRQEIQRLGEAVLQPKVQQDITDISDIRDLLQLLLRYKGLLAVMLLTAASFSLIYTFLKTPIYQATLVLQIEPQATQVVEKQDLAPEEYGGRRKSFYDTQYALLKSANLASRVIDQLDLQISSEDEKIFSKSGLVNFFKNLSISEEDQVANELKETRVKRRYPEGLFLRNLTVTPIGISHLVEIQYRSSDPTEAAAVANAVANNFINMNLDRRYDAGAYAKTFLEEKLAQARLHLRESEERFIAYARERNIVDLDDKAKLLLGDLTALSTQLIETEADRIEAEAKYQRILDLGDASAPETLESSVISGLKGHRIKLETEYEELLEVYQSDYPKMKELQKKIKKVDARIKEEAASIATTVKAQYLTYLDKEKKLRARVKEIKEEILTAQDRTTDFQALKREVETNHQLYDGLLQRMKQIGVAAGVTTNNISIVDAAKIPTSPYKPNLIKNLIKAIALGLFFGAALVILIEMLDDTLKTSEDVEKRTDRPIIGVVPFVAKKEAKSSAVLALKSFDDPRCAFAESFRSLRTALEFSTPEGSPKVIHLTSAVPSEGKSVSAANLAVIFAEAKDRVLLIDTDLRNPSQHKLFGLPNTNGLTNYLAGDARPIDIAQPTRVKNLFLITSGPIPPNPITLLSTAKMVDLISLALAENRFDHIVIDGPPVVGLADALILANHADATLLVVASGSTRVTELKGSIKRLESANAVILGSIVTKQGQARGDYSYDYHYTYTYGKKHELPKSVS